MMSPELIKAYLEESIDCEHLTVIGDGRHFEAVIVSKIFDGKSRVQRHQVIFAVLGDKMKEDIHALSMKTLTPGEWESQ